VKESLDVLERDLKNVTDQAVHDGKADFEAAESSYLAKAFQMADAGLASAQTYVGAGKERLAGPHHAHNAPPTGLAGSLAATAASALDAVSGGIGYAQQNLHQKSPELLNQYNRNPHHAVTSHTKSMGQAVTDTAVAGQAAAITTTQNAKDAVQPHVDAASSLAQPHIDAARPYVDSATATVQSGYENTKQQYNAVATSDKPLAQQVQEGVSAGLNSAKETVGLDKDRPIVPQVQEATKQAYGLDKDKPIISQVKEAYGTNSAPAESGAPQLAGGPGVLPPAVSQTSATLDPSLAPPEATKTTTI